MNGIISKRRSRYLASTPNYHQPIGKSNCVAGAHMSIQELLRSTTLLERQGMQEESSLFDEFPNGNIPAERLLDDIDFSEIPIDITDQQRMIARAQARMRAKYERDQARRKNFVSTNNKRAERAAQSSDVEPKEGPTNAANNSTPKNLRRSSFSYE